MSYLDKKAECAPDSKLIAQFTFCMPFLPKGAYSVAVGIANGSQEIHTMEHWMHDGLIFQSENQREAVGLIGIPMQDISLHQCN